MKKLYLLFIIAFTLFSSVTTYADDFDKWEIIPIDSLPDLPYENKVGDFFFDHGYNSENNRVLTYSTDGINYEFTDYKNPAIPIYSNGLYFVFDHSVEDIPSSKKYGGFNNSPSYILDGNMNVISVIEEACEATYEGCYNGYHYIGKRYYEGDCWTDPSYYNSTLYRTKNGIDMELVLTNKTANYKSDIKWENGAQNIDFLHDMDMYTGDTLRIEGDTDYIVTTVSGFADTYEIVRENEQFFGIWVESEVNKLYEIINIVGKYTKTHENGRNVVYNIEENYLTMDCIYGVKMPEDIGKFRFELDGKFYFEKDDTSYYCIERNELTDYTRVIYNDKVLAFDIPPVIENDRTLVPMRFLFEQMGAEVNWDDTTRTAIADKGDTQIEFSIDNTVATVNSEVKAMDVPARLIDGKTMIPLRFLSEEMGCTVEWDEATKTVMITDKMEG